MSKALLIVGNGFDLKCGLHSKYIDFLHSQRKGHARFDKFIEFLENNSFDTFNADKLHSIEDIIEVEEDISFLDYYFTILDWRSGKLNKEKAWSDIEDMLLYGFSYSNDSFGFHFDDCYSCYDDEITKKEHPYYRDSYPHLIISNYLSKVFNQKQIIYLQFRKYVLSELDAFSLCFSKYINEQVKNNQNYYQQAQELITRITNVGLNECEIISFNYTEPVSGPNLANIHGLASKNKIVLGITCGEGEKKETVHNSWYYKATKEYKIANVLASGIKVYANYDDVTDIFIYGLSLGQQDYDFFDNLFDEFDILMRVYKVTIHFCFSTYGGKSRDEVEIETTSRVAELINHFGDTHKTYGLLRSMIQKGHLKFDYIK